MAQILTKTVLNTIAGALYSGATVAFYSVAPTTGETLVVTLTDGFAFARARRNRGGDSSSLNLWIAGDASITLAQLKVSGVVVITVNSIVKRYAITELLEQQQIGAGFVLRLSPQKGAAG